MTHAAAPAAPGGVAALLRRWHRVECLIAVLAFGFIATVLILEGEGTLTIGGRAVKARAGELVIMPAGVPHDVRAEQPFKMLLIMIRQAT